MADPVGVLLERNAVVSGGGGDSSSALPEREILVCRVKRDTKFYESASVAPQLLDIIDSECELEVLVREENEWMCAVVPGVGLGWVKRDEVASAEREAVGANSSVQASAFYSATLT